MQLLKYSIPDQLHSQLPLYRKIMETDPSLRILIYTGGHVCCVCVCVGVCGCVCVGESCSGVDGEAAGSPTGPRRSWWPCRCRPSAWMESLPTAAATGDTDALVPLVGTRRWTFELGTEEGRKKKTHWRW